MNTVKNGKGRTPEKGRVLPRYREGFAGIRWDRDHSREFPETTPTNDTFSEQYGPNSAPINNANLQPAR